MKVSFCEPHGSTGFRNVETVFVDLRERVIIGRIPLMLQQRGKKFLKIPAKWVIVSGKHLELIRTEEGSAHFKVWVLGRHGVHHDGHGYGTSGHFFVSDGDQIILPVNSLETQRSPIIKIG